MSATPVEVFLAHGLAREVVAQVRERFAWAEDVAATVSRHETGQCGEPFGDPAADTQCCPWHVPWLLAGDLEEVSRATDAWMLAGWVEHGLFERREPGDAGLR